MADRLIVNICFHGIGEPKRELDPGEDRYWIGVDFFRRALDEISDRADVRLSFDDGNASDIEVGLPELRQRSLTATFFALAGRLDKPGSLSTDDLRELRGSGMDIGSHGMRHVPWRRLSANDRYQELSVARDKLAEAAQAPIDDAALPLGHYDRGVLADLRRAGYRSVYSSDRAPARSASWLQPRYSITANDSLQSLHEILSGPGRAGALRTRAKMFIKRLR